MPATPLTIQFGNGNQALAVAQTSVDSATDLLSALGLDRPHPVIILAGGADDLPAAVAPFLLQLFGRGVSRAAEETGAVMLDGGTATGVMELLGQAAADRGHRGPLLGVAATGLVAYPEVSPGGGNGSGAVPLEPNHSHFILADAPAWGGELKTMFEVAAALAHGAKAVTLVAGGGRNTVAEVRQSVRRGWPVIVIAGTGGVADEIAAGHAARGGEVEDPMLAEIYADGELQVFPLHHSAEALSRRIVRALTGDATLRLVWERFAALDAAANGHERTFANLHSAIIGLGVLVTFLVLFKTALDARGALGRDSARALYYVILIVPIVLSILVAASNRLKSGNKWLLMRAAAETVKREIFRYRVRAGAYRSPDTREPTLAQNVEDISRRLARTEINTSALAPYTGPIPPAAVTAGSDDGLGWLTPQQYVAVRLTDQLAFYRRRSLKLDRQLALLQWSIVILGGIATLLAAVGLELWLALVTTLVTSIAGFVGHRQLEATLMTYNQTATDLENVRGWWIALPADDKEEPTNVDKLVDCVEKLLGSELGGWVQKMQDALAELREEEKDTMSRTAVAPKPSSA